MTARAFTVASLAAAWECSPGVIRSLIKHGELGCFRLGTLIRIPAEEVARFECQNIPSSGSEADMPSSGATEESGTDSDWARMIARERKLRQGVCGPDDGTIILRGRWGK